MCIIVVFNTVSKSIELVLKNTIILYLYDKCFPKLKSRFEQACRFPLTHLNNL